MIDNKFKGQLDPSEIKISGNTLDLTVVWLAYYNLQDAQVQLTRFGVHKYTKIGNDEYLRGFLWSERQTSHYNICLSGPSHNGVDRVFSSEATARKFMLFAGLNGYAIDNKIVKTTRKPLQRISIAPKDPQDDQDN